MFIIVRHVVIPDTNTLLSLVPSITFRTSETRGISKHLWNVGKFQGYYMAQQRNIPEDSRLHTCCREDLKYHSET
jgi:hypothetical protein